MVTRGRTLIAALCVSTWVSHAQADTLAQRPGVWAQTYTERAADPAIRFGRLPNGMRFAIMHNATPSGHMSLQLDIGSGAFSETPTEQGLAHFLEHMAFRGSTNMADGEMTRTLARYGLSFGADLNATTFQLATVYKFDFPQSADADIDIALMLFREIASNLTIDPAAVDKERGVVLSEERQADKPGFHATKALFEAWLPGQLVTKRWPIGSIDVLQLRHDPVSDDELQRAKQPLAQRRIRQMQEEDYWLNLLTAEPPDTRVRDMLRTRVSGLRAVTAEDVRAVVDRFLSTAPFAIQVTSAKP